MDDSRQIASDDWNNDESVDYHQVEEDPDRNEDRGPTIQYCESDDDVFDDINNFAGKMLDSFLSLGS